MNNFDDFDFYRVGAWMRDGLIISIAEPVATAARQAVAKVAVVAAVAVGGMSAAVAAVAHPGPSGVVLPSISSPQNVGLSAHYEIVERDISAMTSEIDSQLADFMSFSSDDFDEESLALAARALSASVAREEVNLSTWALGMVSQRS
jgi:hypothetical protein